MKNKLSFFPELIGASVALLIGCAFSALLYSQQPINVGPDTEIPPGNPFSGLPRPSAAVAVQPDATMCFTVPPAPASCVTIPGPFVTALEKDRVDTLIPAPGADGKGFVFNPVNADGARHLLYLMLQDNGPLVNAFRKYPPKAVQDGVDAANAAVKDLGQQINAARTAAQAPAKK